MVDFGTCLKADVVLVYFLGFGSSWCCLGHHFLRRRLANSFFILLLWYGFWRFYLLNAFQVFVVLFSSIVGVILQNFPPLIFVFFTFRRCFLTDDFVQCIIDLLKLLTGSGVILWRKLDSRMFQDSLCILCVWWLVVACLLLTRGDLVRSVICLSYRSCWYDQSCIVSRGRNQLLLQKCILINKIMHSWEQIVQVGDVEAIIWASFHGILKLEIYRPLVFLIDLLWKIGRQRIVQGVVAVSAHFAIVGL